MHNNEIEDMIKKNPAKIDEFTFNKKNSVQKILVGINNTIYIIIKQSLYC